MQHELRDSDFVSNDGGVQLPASAAPESGEQSAATYWAKMLAGLPQVHGLPLDRPRGARADFTTAKANSHLDAAMTLEFARLCESESASLQAGLHAAFALLVARHSGERDIAVGTPAGGTLGVAILRSDLSRAQTFRELLVQSRDGLHRARAHLSLSFAELLATLQVQPSDSHAPLFQLMVALQGESAAVAPARIELTLSATRTTAGLTLDWIYATELFDAETIERLARHFAVLTKSILASPDGNVWQLPLLDAAEYRCVVEEWNDTAAPFPDSCLHELFALQVRRTPEATALACAGSRLSYVELNERANRLAHYLRARGVVAQSLVGVCMERSLDMVVGMLAILKAGGAYVPLDPQYPPERLAFMVEDSGAAWVLTQERTRASLGEGAAHIVLDDPAFQQTLQSFAADDPQPLPGHDTNALAYIIYTSGSTGTPKGVCIEHRHAAALIAWAQAVYDASMLSGVLAATSICFDLSVFELFVPLCTGGCAIVVKNALDIEGIKNAQGVTLINTVPSAIRVLVDERQVPDSVKVVNLAGEALPRALVQDIYRHTHAAAVFNLYGPSEDTTYSTYALIDRDGAGPPPIGKPISNGQAYVLDSYLQPVPIGVVGEIYVGGAGVARGYWNRPQLTRERFIADPLHPSPGARLYKTGDLGRWLANGELEYSGRIDHQIKLRGFRIELGEIQAQLLAMETLGDALVVARDTARGEKQLVAYLVPNDSAAPAHLLVEACKTNLHARLPEYMVPVAYVVLERLPLTPNGKVDRAALPAPEENVAEYLAPASPLEAELVRLWQEVLGLRTPVSVDADFFDLGGHSLVAVQMLSRVQQRFGATVALKALFEAPTVRAFALEITKSNATESLPLRRVPRGDVLPLSYGQQQLWLVDQLDGGSLHYNLPLRFLLEGALDVAALRNALQSVIDRHESLRTVMVLHEQQPVQRILDRVSVELTCTDLRGLPEAARAVEAERRIRDDVRRPFLLDREPMLRAMLLQFAPERYELLLNLHHIASDAWSMGILKSELSALYEAAADGKVAELPELPVQYADYAVWQRSSLQEETLEPHMRYWMQRLDGIPTVHHLPLDRPRPPQQNLVGAVYRNHLDADLLRAFKDLCRKGQATLFMGLHAAFSVLLARHSGESDIVMGTPIATRDRAELTRLIGLFVNTLVLRSQVARETNFMQMLAQSRDTALDAYTHQQLPLEQLVERLQLERTESHALLFQVTLSLQNADHTSLRLSDLEVTPLPAHSAHAPFELMLEATQTAEGLSLDWAYRSQLFDATTIERLAGHLVNLLRAAIAQPTRSVWELPLLDTAERQQLLMDWNATAAGFVRDRCVHELFEVRARHAPGAIAIASSEEQLSYGELARRANRCAHFLRAQGVGPDVVVGVCVERSVDMVVAMLGVLKAGGAYLPLDSGYPRARIDYMLNDSGTRIVLTQQQLAASWDARVTLIPVDAPGIFDSYPDTPPDPVGVTPKSLAYLIYTSGSTGEPKGVMNTHAGLANLCQWHAAAFGTDSSSRCTLIASVGFDAAVWELWSALLSGSCAVPVSDTVRTTPHLLGAFLREQRITHCFMPTGLLEAMRDSDVFASEHLRVLLCGGDKLQRYCLPQGSKARLFNCYGPTEAAVVATSFEMSPDSTALIGKPIANVQAYVLNDALEPQPIGVSGELYIGGAGLARGYWNAPALTHARFIRNPWSDDPEARLYQTGDFARVLADGNIEFIGRRDDQVKLRGFRIELGEIESHMSAHPQVQAALTMLREDVPGQRRLVGYITLKGSDSTTEQSSNIIVAAIKAALREALPEYMVPASLVVLSEFPLTANGKIDRAKLPVPEVADNEQQSDAPPRTATEIELAAIWSQLLQRDQIGIDSNFFEAGGHSLLVTQMIHAIVERLQVPVTTRDVFRQPTIRELAAVLDSRGKLAGVAPQPDADGSAIPLSLCQFRVWYVEQTRGETNEHNMPAAMMLRGAVDAVLLERALNAVVARHDMLRTRFALEQEMPVQILERALEVSIEYHDLTTLPASEVGARVQAIAAQHATRPFDIQRLPLLSALLVRIAADEYRLQFNFHHLILDGWSFTLFRNELLAAYEALAAGNEPSLPPLVHKYAHFVHWQRQWLQGAEASAQAQFWREYLQDCSEQLALPGQAVASKDESRVGTRVSAQMAAGTRQALAALARSKQGTLFNVLYSAFALLLARLSGQHDLNIGIPVNGRHVQGSQGVIGNFLNNLPVRNRVSLDQKFGEYLAGQIRNLEQVLSNQDYPFEKILELSPRLRKADATPLFQVFFNMLSLPQGMSSRLLAAEAVECADIAPKFDLTLYVEDGEDGIGLTCHYNAAQFATGAMQHLLRQYVCLLEQVARDAQLPCGDYSLRPDVAEEGKRDLEPRRFWLGAVHDLFRQRAFEQPDAVAIIEQDQQWTYGEVLRASTKLAKSLRQRGVGPGDVVGIVAARRACLVVGVMAALQTGAAFSLLNPEYPVERVCLLSTIVKPACLLFAGDRAMFAAALTDRLESMVPCEYLPAAKQVVAEEEVHDFTPAQVDPLQLACVTFTSGTTGTPKAVAGVHIGIAGYFAWVPQWLEISRADRFSMLSGLGHDPIQRDMFSSLCAGASLVIPDPEVIAPQLLAQWLKRNGVTFVHMTPAMAQILCTTEETGFPNLRVTFLTGEKLHGGAVADLLRFNPAMRILNSYGTTETQRAVTYFEASKGMGGNHGAVPISESSPDAVVRVLNSRGTPCGIGEVGDIFIESYALSMGYRNDSELTAKVLTHLPDGRRRYRTGDVGCRLVGGTVAVLGRKDGQINIRGFRVEPGEIEAQIRSLPRIKDAVVLLTKREGDEPALVAYAVPHQYVPENRALRTEMLEHLKATLPVYMVPAAVVLLEQFPITPNGKLDRHALPEPAWSDASGYVAPATEMEHTLATIWSEVLKVERVGVHDNFFALGGHSMLMVLLLTHLRRRVKVPFKMNQILGCGTIREQAQVLSNSAA